MLKKIITNHKQRIVDLTQPTLDHWDDLSADFKSRRANFFRNRTVSQDLLEENFPLLLNAWGMSKADIPVVIRTLKVRVVILLLPLFLAAALAAQGFLILSLIISAAVIFSVSTTLWRISILKSMRFCAYYRALFGFFKKSVKG